MQHEPEQITGVNSLQHHLSMFIFEIQHVRPITVLSNRLIETHYKSTRYTVALCHMLIAPTSLSHHKRAINMFSFKAKRMEKVLLPEESPGIEQSTKHMLIEIGTQITHQGEAFIDRQSQPLQNVIFPVFVYNLRTLHNDL